MAIDEETKKRARARLAKKQQGLRDSLKDVAGTFGIPGDDSQGDPVYTDASMGPPAPVEPAAPAFRDVTQEEYMAAMQNAPQGTAGVSPAPPSAGGSPSRPRNPSTGGALGALEEGGEEAMKMRAQGLGEFSQATDEASDAIRAAGEIGAQVQELQAQGAEQRAVLQTQMAAREAEVQKDVQARLKEQQAKITSAEQLLGSRLSREEFDEHNAIINDPAATEDEKAEAQQKLNEGKEYDPGILGSPAFALIVGGILGSRLPGIGQVLGMLQKQTIQNQKLAFGRNREAYEREQNSLAQMTEAFGDEKEAREYMDSLKLDSLAAMVEKQSAGLKADETRANAEKMATDLRQAAAEKKMGVVERQAAATENLARQEASIRQDIGQRRDEMRLASMTKEDLKSLPAGVAQKLGDVKGLFNSLSTLETDFADLGSMSLMRRAAANIPGSDAQAFQKKRNTFQSALGNWLSGTGMTESETERYKQMVPEAGDSEGTAKSKMEALRELLVSRSKGTLEVFSEIGYQTPDALFGGEFEKGAGAIKEKKKKYRMEKVK